MFTKLFISRLHCFKKMDPEKRRLDDYVPTYIRKKHRLSTKTPRLANKPKIDSDQLFKYDKKVLKKARMKEHEDWLK